MILVTGASGLLGANLVKKLLHKSIDTVALYNTFPLFSRGLCSLKADLRNQGYITKLVRKYQPKWIVHCAAETNVDWCEKNPPAAYEINALMTGDLAKQGERVGAGFIYISTDSVFDGLKGNYKECDATNPLNVYASSKLAGERAAENNNVNCVILRTNIYGWNLQNKQSLAEWIINKYEANQKITGFNDVFFSPILVNDLSDIIVDMINQQATGLYHATGSGSCSKYDFAKMLGEVFGYDQDLVIPISVGSKNFTAPRPKNTTLDNTKLSRKLCLTIPDIKSGLMKLKQLRDNGFVKELKQMKGAK